MVANIIRSVSYTLSDVDHVTYTEPMLLDALNNACSMVVVYRPDAYQSIADVTLVAGIQQSLPDTAIRLMETFYTASGRPVQMVDRKEIDRSRPDWVNADAQAEIKEVMYDERFPNRFFVYPPATNGAVIRLGYSTMPPVITSTDTALPISPKYRPAVIEWMLYQMFSLDSQNAQSQQQAMSHSQQFYNILQVKMQSDQLVAPLTSQTRAAG